MPDVAAVCMEVCMEAFKVEMSKKKVLEVKLKKVEKQLEEKLKKMRFINW